MCQVSFSWNARPDSFSAVPRASGPFFMFCAPELVFGSTEGVGSRFHGLRARTRFRWYRGRRVPFSFFVLPNSFSAVWSATGPVFMFCALGIIFGGAEGVGSRFHVLPSRTCFRRYRGRRSRFHVFLARARFRRYRGVPSRLDVLCSRTRFRRYRGRRVSFLCFVLPNSFSAVSRVSGPVLMCCAPGLIFDGIEGVWSLFHVLRAQTSFRRH
jgi:hypothetical protein